MRHVGEHSDTIAYSRDLTPATPLHLLLSAAVLNATDGVCIGSDSHWFVGNVVGEAVRLGRCHDILVQTCRRIVVRCAVIHAVRHAVRQTAGHAIRQAIDMFSPVVGHVITHVITACRLQVSQTAANGNFCFEPVTDTSSVHTRLSACPPAPQSARMHTPSVRLPTRTLVCTDAHTHACTYRAHVCCVVAHAVAALLGTCVSNGRPHCWVHVPVTAVRIVGYMCQ